MNISSTDFAIHTFLFITCHKLENILLSKSISKFPFNNALNSNENQQDIEYLQL